MLFQMCVYSYWTIFKTLTLVTSFLADFKSPSNYNTRKERRKYNNDLPMTTSTGSFASITPVGVISSLLFSAPCCVNTWTEFSMEDFGGGSMKGKLRTSGIPRDIICKMMPSRGARWISGVEYWENSS